VIINSITITPENTNLILSSGGVPPMKVAIKNISPPALIVRLIVFTIADIPLNGCPEGIVVVVVDVVEEVVVDVVVGTVVVDVVVVDGVTLTPTSMAVTNGTNKKNININNKIFLILFTLIIRIEKIKVYVLRPTAAYGKQFYYYVEQRDCVG
jgi:hypothetical protein